MANSLHNVYCLYVVSSVLSVVEYKFGGETESRA